MVRGTADVALRCAPIGAAFTLVALPVVADKTEEAGDDVGETVTRTTDVLVECTVTKFKDVLVVSTDGFAVSFVDDTDELTLGVCSITLVEKGIGAPWVT
jgi:hypothetical protein